jgi:cell division protein FtsQ
VSKPSRVVPAGPRIAARAAAERHDRRHTRLRRAGLLAVVAVPLAFAGWVLLGSPLLAVQKVVVTGETRLSEAQITAAAAVDRGTPLARVDTGAVARRIRALGPVSSVTVTRGWPHSLRITVVERVPVVAVAHGTSLQLLDYSGVEIAEVTAAPRGVFRLDSGSPDATRAALTVLHGLPRGIAGRLGSLRAPTPEQVTLVLRDGRQILWGGPVDSASKASAVLALIRMPGTVFDVSAPGVVTRR